jgi:hypothetical protein
MPFMNVFQSEAYWLGNALGYVLIGGAIVFVIWWAFFRKKK